MIVSYPGQRDQLRVGSTFGPRRHDPQLRRRALSAAFNTIKHRRGLATRYDVLVAALDWLTETGSTC
jgi:hypothetical protein